MRHLVALAWRTHFRDGTQLGDICLHLVAAILTGFADRADNMPPGYARRPRRGWAFEPAPECGLAVGNPSYAMSHS